MARKATTVVNGVKYNLYEEGYAEITTIDKTAVDVTVPRSVEFEGVEYVVKKIKEFKPKNLRSLDLSETEITSITHSEVFSYDNLERLVLPHNLTPANGFMGRCPKLKEIVLPENDCFVLIDGDLYSRDNDGNLTLEMCSPSKNGGKLVLPENTVGMSTSSTYSCDSLSEVVIPQSLNVHVYPFYYTRVGRFSLSGDGERYKEVDGVIYSLDMTQIFFASVDGSEGVLRVPETVETINDHAFNNCQMEEVHFDNLENIDYIGCAFWHCDKLKTIDIPPVDRLSSSFTGCTSLVSVCVPNTVKTMDNTFDGCRSLVEVTFEKGSNVTYMEGTFEGCSSLKEIEIPRSVNFPGVCFRGCVSLKKIIFHSYYPRMEEILDGCPEDVEVINR